MKERDSRKWRDRAVAIEFWIATIVVGGSFLVGVWQMVRRLF
ncbi:MULTISPECIES: hypothetical protein [Sphingopyxis]|uniref:Uncharacterized protein n=1 Tax=Sphingopyxis panaciterrulae TaxID=462372 RepID=A0A7W9ETV0_9SPHN|nr:MULTISPECIES: hypothetical protein [Sphingopyxis]MBB5708585.1 hypothetical protein [Sphingopyxis panaciterrulae]MCW0197628.1 hypothetical protein [Sphingopyxis sp.]